MATGSVRRRDSERDSSACPYYYPGTKSIFESYLRIRKFYLRKKKTLREILIIFRVGCHTLRQEKKRGKDGFFKVFQWLEGNIQKRIERSTTISGGQRLLKVVGGLHLPAKKQIGEMIFFLKDLGLLLPGYGSEKVDCGKGRPQSEKWKMLCAAVRQCGIRKGHYVWY